MKIEIITLGVYGFEEESFFQVLSDHEVDTFCDIRDRRGMRGPLYKFVNSKALQDKLKEMGIRYFHFKKLAPTREIRALQKSIDHREKIPKRQRDKLCPEFKKAYRKRCMKKFCSKDFIHALPEDMKIGVLFCVEKRPEACHRSLIADRLKRDLNVKIRHIVPEEVC